MRWLVCVLLIVACEGGGGDGKDNKGGGKDKDGNPLPVAKPAPTWCDGKKCPCKVGDEKLPKDAYKTCELGSDLVVQGVPCGTGRIEFWPDGKLQQCDLKSPVMVGRYECHVGIGIVRLHKDGALKRCNVKGEFKVGALELAPSWGTFDFELYANGALREGELKAPAKFGSRTCAAGKVGLYADGKVYSCNTAEPIVVDDTLTLPKDTPVNFAADGTLSGFFPQNTVKYKGEEKKAGWAVCIVKDCNTWPPSPD